MAPSVKLRAGLRSALVFVTVSLAADRLWAQQPPAAPPTQVAPLTGSISAHPGWPAANPEDVKSPETLLNALYSTLSGPAGQVREWQRFRSLFLPDAQLIPIRPLPGGHNDAVILTPDAYVERARLTMAREGFFERGIHLHTERLGAMVHAWSTYESRRHVEDPEPFARGINSVQMLEDGGRYWIVNLLWNAETPSTPISPEFLPGSSAGPSARADVPRSASPASATGLTGRFAGRWSGTLEYRDYQSDSRTTLPTWLTMESTAGGDGVTLRYTYDDGPTKAVREQETLTFSPAYAVATLLSEGPSSSTTTFKVEGLETLHQTGTAHLVLTGIANDNGKPADVRIHLTLARNLFTWRRETRPRNSTEPFRFRNEYTLTRELPPATP